MIANSATCSRIQIEESRGWHLVMPYIGFVSVTSDRNSYQLRSGTNALLLPNMRRSAERQSSSMVIATIDIDKLVGTIAAMAGDPFDSLTIDERVFQIHMNRVPGLFQSFVQISRMIDALPAKEELTKYLGVEDMIYRWLALALHHSNGYDTLENRWRPPVTKVDLACDLMRNSTGRALTLTEIEIATGLSSRALQYAFKARFGISPMEWQRRERMLQARIRLMQSAPTDTITDIAHSMGFSSSSAFSTLYKRHFGEMPSETKRYRQTSLFFASGGSGAAQ